MSEVAQPTAQTDRKGIYGWMMFDWSTQPFHTLIITFVFAPYFASHIAATPVSGQEIWGYGVFFAGFLVAVFAPILGAIADSTGPRKPWILAFGTIGAIGCLILWNAEPGTEHIAIALVGLIIAYFGLEFAAVFNNAMMPDLVPRTQLGRLLGFRMGTRVYWRNCLARHCARLHGGATGGRQNALWIGPNFWTRRRKF